jgi:GT2 family glycosyltransferase
MHQTAVVILNFNGLGFLKEFIPILIQHTSNQARLVVADNASSDDSVTFLRNQYPEVELVLLKQNFGFAEGYNQALKQIEAKYFVLLNSDVEVTQNWLPPLIDLLENDNIAACQPKILSYHNRASFEYAGAAGGYLDYFGYPFCRGRIIDTLEFDNGQYNNNIEIFWASGACLAIKSQAFFSIGGFDGSFFAHMEEIDLCWRLQLNGQKIFSNSTSTVYHVGGGTLPKSNPHKTFLNFRNGLEMNFKNSPKKNFYFRIIGRLLFDGVAGLGYLLKGNFKDCYAIIKAHFAFYRKYSILKQKREIILNELTVIDLPENIYKKSIIIEYYFRQKKKFSDLNWIK